MPLLVTHAPGIYRRDDGQIFRVKFTRTFDKIYSQQLVGAKWVYSPSAITTLTAEMLLTLDAARTVSRELAQCIACGRMLSDTGSLGAGMGLLCSRRWTEKPKRPYRLVTDAKISEMRELARAYEEIYL